MEPIYSFEVSLFVNVILKHIDAFAPSWHKLKKAIRV